MQRQTRFLFFVSALVLTALACNATSGVGGPTQDPNVLFRDDFSSDSSGWDTYSDETGGTTYFEGSYRINVLQTNFDYWANPGLDFTDTSTTVTATKAGGPDDNDFGILCRYSEPAGLYSFYMFVASSDGLFNIAKVVLGEQTNLYDSEGFWGESDAIKQGNATNTLRADCVGSTLTFYINGTQVAQVQDSSLSNGDVGLIAGSFDTAGTDILFDDIVVSKP